MKLILKKTKSKNFMSVGNVPVEVEYKTGLHLVNGTIAESEIKNGVGKTQLFIDTVIFAFYGKSIRGLNKNKIVNDQNEKECEVTVWFSLNGVNYRIERGILPDYFRVINEDEEQENKLQKETAKRETQKSINEMMPTSFTSFLNTITLNINYSKPFFKLEKAEKRIILEDVTNLAIYGKMFEKTKKDYNVFKSENKLLKLDVTSKQEMYDERLTNFNKIEQLRKEFESEKTTNIDNTKKQIDEITEKIQSYTSKIPSKNFDEIKVKLETAIDTLNSKNIDISSRITTHNNIISNNKEEIQDLKDNPICPRCKTVTKDSTHTQSHIEELQTELQKSTESVAKFKQKKIEIVQKIEEFKAKKSKIEESIKKVDALKNHISSLNEKLNNLNENLLTIQNKQFSMVGLTSKVDVDKSKSVMELKTKELNDNTKMMKYYEFMKEILGDDGIKRYIIKKIIPLLNKKINEYLSVLKADYTISFDSDFNETFKFKNRIERGYNGFSAGEQKRIDLATMFALLYIAKLQNSIDCNILILDEIIDSSMCVNGIMNLINYLKTDFMTENPSMCVYVVTHKTEISENNFNSVISIKRENGFTKIDEVREVDQIVQV